MREIKFRLWDRKRKKMFFGPTDDNPSPSWVLAAATVCGDPVMQFTGLKDKNGKEIYEGDIVRCYHEYWDQKVSHEVGFDSYGITIGGTHLSLDHSVVFEVIGNIYENPELVHKDLP